MSQVARLSSKGQVTVPARIRKTLHVSSGDLIAWDVDEQGRVTIRRVAPLDIDYLAAVNGTLSEWTSREDDEAYGNL
jgi:AbrB family looped-hinge helix DNA binding protein